jgi:hypothetical protein
MLFVHLKGTGHSGDTGLYGRVILKLMLSKYDGFLWLKIGMG